MTTATINDIRLTDSAERDMVRRAMDSNSPVRTGALRRSIAQGAMGLYTFVRDVNAAMNDARARSAHYTGSQW